MRAREFIKNQINLVFTSQKMSAVHLKEYFIARSRLYKLDEDQYVYYPSRAQSNFNGWDLIKENFNTILSEGGNVFAGRTSGIAKENIEPTLLRYFQELQQIFPQKASIFNTKYFQPLGSVGKKPISGDIDLGVDISHIIDQSFSDQSIAAWGLDPESVRSEAKVLQSRARTATPEQIMLKAFLKKLTLYINSHAPNLYCDEKKVTAGNIFGLYPQFDSAGNKIGTGVQIDWMIGNINWLHFSYYSSAYPEGSNVKGLHRTQLMLATFGQAGYSFNHVSGVKNKSTNEIVATDPTIALKILSDSYGINFTPNIVENYYKLHNTLKTLPKQQYNAIIDSYLKILDSTRADIPDDLQQYWIANQQRLGLTGKFLPPESKLISYKQETV